MPKRLDHPHPEPSALDCATAEELFDTYLDGDLDLDQQAAERYALEHHLASCPVCAAELELARRVALKLRELPTLDCPPAVSRAVLAHAAAHPPFGERLAAWWSFPRRWQSAFALLLVTALALGYWRLTSPTEPPAPAYSAAEVARAEADVKLAFAYLGQISRKAGDTMGTDVLENRMVVPVGRSLAAKFFPAPAAAPPAPAPALPKRESHDS